MTIEASDIEHMEKYPTLGPHYNAAHKVAEGFMASFEAEQFKPLIDKFAKELQDRLWTDVQNWLLSDTESNIQAFIWRRIDDSVKALLSGERWALERYCLGSRYEHDKIREALAKVIPQELQDKRIADLEDEVKQLHENLEWARR